MTEAIIAAIIAATATLLVCLINNHTQWRRFAAEYKAKQQQEIDTLKRHDKKDHEELIKLHKLSRAQCKMSLVILDHMIDGNHVEQMKKTRDDIIELMTDD